MAESPGLKQDSAMSYIKDSKYSQGQNSPNLKKKKPIKSKTIFEKSLSIEQKTEGTASPNAATLTNHDLLYSVDMKQRFMKIKNDALEVV